VYTTDFGIHALKHMNQNILRLCYMAIEQDGKTQKQQFALHKKHLDFLNSNVGFRSCILDLVTAREPYNPTAALPNSSDTIRTAAVRACTFPKKDKDKVYYYPTLKHLIEDKRVATSYPKYVSVLKDLDAIDESAMRGAIEEYNIATAQLTVKIDNTVEWFRKIYLDPRTPSCMGGKGENHFKQLPVEAYCFEGTPFSLAAVYADDVLVSRALCVKHEGKRYACRCYTNSHAKSRSDDIKQALEDNDIRIISDIAMPSVLNGKRMVRIDMEDGILFPYIDPKGLAAIVYPDRLELTNKTALASNAATREQYPDSEGFILPVHSTGISKINRWPTAQNGTDTTNDYGLAELETIYDYYTGDHVSSAEAIALVRSDERLIVWERNDDNELVRALNTVAYADIDDMDTLYCDQDNEGLVVLDERYYPPLRCGNTKIYQCAPEDDTVDTENDACILRDHACSTYSGDYCHEDDDDYAESDHHGCRIHRDEAYYIEQHDDYYHTDFVVHDYNNEPQLEEDCVRTPDGRYYLKDDLDI